MRRHARAVIPSAALAFAGLVSSTGCGASSDRAAHAPPSELGAAASRAHGASLFHTATDKAFWVDRGAERDALVVDGNRCEVSPEGRVLAVAVHESLPLRGGLRVRDDLGGGYVFWSNERVFRAASFTGPLEPFEGEGEGQEVLGARNGLRGVVAFFANGQARLDLERRALAPDAFPGLADIAALDGRRALMMDVLGRGWITVDGGATRKPLVIPERDSIRSIGLSPDSIWIDAWHEYYEISGDLSAAPESASGYAQSDEPFEIRFRANGDDWRTRTWSPYETSLLQSALLSGVRLDDETALAVSPRMQAEVDLATGAVRSLMSDSLSEGLLCQPIGIGGAVLHACRWQQYQYFGAYVFRGEGAGPPVLERAFSDDGTFVGTLDGGLAYTGSCTYRERLPEDGSFPGNQAPATSLTICVRDPSGAWLERSLPESFGKTVERWVPHPDGSAVAIVRAFEEGLDGFPPPAADDGSARLVDGVRVVAIGGLAGGATLVAGFPHDGSRSRFQQIDQAFSVLPDGSIRGWAAKGDAMVEGIRIDRDGRVERFDLPKGSVASLGTDAYGLATTVDGDLFETTDGGASWQAAGKTPVARREFTGGCSALGCALGSLARVGWGTTKTAVTWREGAAPVAIGRPAKPHLPRLACAPSGPPEPVAATLGGNDRRTYGTGYGDVFFVDRLAVEGGAPREEGEPVETTVVDTHALTFSPPFELRPKPRVFKGVLEELSSSSNVAVPLLDAKGAVGLLLTGTQQEHLVTEAGLEPLPIFESERYDWRNNELPSAGLLLDPDRAMVVGSIRQRSTLEEHRAGKQRMPLFFGIDANAIPRRSYALGRAGQGGIGLLALGGASPDPVGVAEVVEGYALGPLEPLAPWSEARPLTDAACREARDGYRALLVIEPAKWFDLVDPAEIALGYRGLLQVRWSAKAACVERIFLTADDGRRGSGEMKIVASFGEPDAGRGAFRSDDLWQPVRCTIQAAEAPSP